MKEQTNIKLQVTMAVSMFLISVFMTVSYYIKIINDITDTLTTIAFYVWICSIFVWFFITRHNLSRLKQNKDESSKRQKTHF
jgi:hypothetical protein